VVQSTEYGRGTDRAKVTEPRSQIEFAVGLRLDVVNWIEGFYNERRMQHSAPDYRSPADYERALIAA
jgi:hypothetical protein